MSAIIQINQVSKQFKQLKAVDDLSLSVESNEIYGFLGPNGSGKSTTLRMMLTLLYPDQGEILIKGKNVFKDRKVLNDIGFIIEKPDFYNYLSALDNLKLFAKLRGAEQGQTYLMDLLKKVGLADREKDKVKTYSHGMKQRLGLAQALLHNPSIIILDEPNTGLDPQGIIELRHLLLELNKNEGKTILLSSHILSEIEEIADSMIVIHKGKTVAQGKVNDILNAELLHVKFESLAYDKLLNDIQSSRFAQQIVDCAAPYVSLQLSNEQIAELNQYLIEHNNPISGIFKTRGLEEYFLKITHEQ